MKKIIFLNDIASITKVRITIDNKKKDIFFQFKNNQYKFIKCKDGLYYFYTTNNDTNSTYVNDYFLLNTVKEKNTIHPSKM